MPQRSLSWRAVLGVTLVAAAAFAATAPVAATAIDTRSAFVEAGFRVPSSSNVHIVAVRPAYRSTRGSVVLPATGRLLDPTQLVGTFTLGGAVQFRRGSRILPARRLLARITSTRLCVSAMIGGRRRQLTCTIRRGGVSGLWSETFAPSHLRAALIDQTAMPAATVERIARGLRLRSPLAVRARVRVVAALAGGLLTSVGAGGRDALGVGTAFRGTGIGTGSLAVLRGGLAPLAGVGRVVFAGELTLVGVGGRVVRLTEPRFDSTADRVVIRATVDGFDEEIAVLPALVPPLATRDGLVVLAPQPGAALDVPLSANGADVVNRALGLAGTVDAYGAGEVILTLRADVPTAPEPPPPPPAG